MCIKSSTSMGIHTKHNPQQQQQQQQQQQYQQQQQQQQQGPAGSGLVGRGIILSGRARPRKIQVGVKLPSLLLQSSSPRSSSSSSSSSSNSSMYITTLLTVWTVIRTYLPNLNGQYYMYILPTLTVNIGSPYGHRQRHLRDEWFGSRQL